jgi:hypothetical protein
VLQTGGVLETDETHLQDKELNMSVLIRSLTIFWSLSVWVGCTSASAAEDAATLTPAASTTEITSANTCPVTEPVWIKRPADSAVQDPPEYGYYFVNKDHSIWASAWWVDAEEPYLRASTEGIKVGWFRPAGATLEITGHRLDGESPPLEAYASCCYPTRFQASGLIFPTEGCWEVTAKAADKELSFVVWVEPEESKTGMP